MSGAPPAAVATMTYRLKPLSLVDGRRTPIVLQAANGPCPLLAIANVLLLRGAISLPTNAPDISEERLVSLVAGWLLDSNNPAKLGQGASPEYRANLEQNLADAVARLPKLTTGIDLNPRFHDCAAYEFTDEVAIFDLLQVKLLHGWLVDPQDEEAVRVIGGTSYNELLSRLIALLGDDAPAAAAAASAASASGPAPGRAAASLASPPASGASTAAPPKPSQTATSDSSLAPEASDDSFNRRLQAALALSIKDRSGVGSGGAAEDGLRSGSAVVTPNSAAAAAFDRALHSRGGSLHIVGAVPGLSDPPAQQWSSPPVPPPLPRAMPQPAQEPQSPKFTLDDDEEDDEAGPAAAQQPVTAAQQPAATAEPASAPAAATAMEYSSAAAPPAGRHTSEVGATATVLGEAEEAAQAVRRLVEAAFRPHLGASAAAATPVRLRDTQQQREAELIQDFLSTSQLTYHGLTELHATLKPMELAVFFRNNHFGTLAKHKDGALYLLVTDQGYLREPGVVWERLSGIDGDTQFFKADFTPFGGKASLQDQAATAAVLAQAAFAGHVPEGGAKEGAPAAPNTSADADLALALQMQEDEAEQAREQQRREQQQRAAAPQQQGRQQPQQHQQLSVPQRQQQQQQGGGGGGQQQGQGLGRWSRRASGGSGRQQQGGGQQVLTGQPPAKDKCTVM